MPCVNGMKKKHTNNSPNRMEMENGVDCLINGEGNMSFFQILWNIRVFKYAHYDWSSFIFAKILPTTMKLSYLLEYMFLFHSLFSRKKLLLQNWFKFWVFFVQFFEKKKIECLIYTGPLMVNVKQTNFSFTSDSFII